MFGGSAGTIMPFSGTSTGTQKLQCIPSSGSAKEFPLGTMCNEQPLTQKLAEQILTAQGCLLGTRLVPIDWKLLALVKYSMRLNTLYSLARTFQMLLKRCLLLLAVVCLLYFQVTYFVSS